MRTTDLIGPALDWAVGIADKRDLFLTTPGAYVCAWKICSLTGEQEASVSYNPSTNWSQGGPIIEREGVELYWHRPTSQWGAYPRDRGKRGFGPTPLIAAMRCFVASKLGDEVDIPKELQ